MLIKQIALNAKKNKYVGFQIYEKWHQNAGVAFKNSRSQMHYKKAVFKNFGIFTGKHLCWSLF